MSFVNALIWIAVIYTAYYIVVFAYDAITVRTVKETTGVEEFTVQRPDDKAVKVVTSNHDDYKPKNVGMINTPPDVQTNTKSENDGRNGEQAVTIPLPSSDDDNNNGDGGSTAEKKKLTVETNTVKEVTKIKLADLKTDFPVDGQQLSIFDLQNEADAFSQQLYQEAAQENSLLRQHVGKLIF
jgi:hypothetical protein